VALRRLIDAYGLIAKRLAGQIDALVLEIAALPEATAAQVVRLERYTQLLDDVMAELANFRGFASVEMSAAARRALEDGLKASRVLVEIQLAGQPGIIAQFHRLPADAVEALLGFLDPGGPLYKRLGELPNVTAQRVANAIVEGVALGRGPRLNARIINALGMGLTDAMRMMRTAQLWAYREANRASYIANADVVRGWTWMAELDGSTCMSCIAMHGTEHSVEETLNDHHNGRCAMVPLVGDRPNPIEQSGEDWFRGQDEAAQRASMGKGKFEAWQKEQFEFGQLVGVHTDEVYGEMRVETPLKSLVAE
jgi:hypothetical protein